jgi:glycosyltransferase involved in cell wall biosynthesis
LSDDRQMINISVVIPAFREEKSVGIVIEKTHNVMTRLGKSFEIVVVDDGSDDRTGSIASTAGARVITHPYNIGYGAALKTGIRFARGQIIVMMDADGQHDPEDIPALLEKLGKYDMVVGARSRESETRLHRDLANRIYNGFASYVCNYRIQDLTSGFKAINTNIARSFLGILPNTFSFSTTITMAVLRSGFSLSYVPIHTSFPSGKSKIRLIQDGSRFFLIIMKIATLFSPMKLFLPVSASLFLGGLGYGIFRIIFMGGRYGQASGLVMVMSVIIFMVGLVSEQIAQLRFDRIEHWLPIQEETRVDEEMLAEPQDITRIHTRQ